MDAIDKAIKSVGSMKQLANELGIKYQSIQNWRKRGYVPCGRAVEIEELTRGEVMRHELSPELFTGYRPIKTPEPTDA